MDSLITASEQHAVSGLLTPLSWSFTQTADSHWDWEKLFPAARRLERPFEGRTTRIPFRSARTQESAEVRTQIHFRKPAAIVVRARAGSRSVHTSAREPSALLSFGSALFVCVKKSESFFLRETLTAPPPAQVFSPDGARRGCDVTRRTARCESRAAQVNAGSARIQLRRVSYDFRGEFTFLRRENIQMFHRFNQNGASSLLAQILQEFSKKDVSDHTVQTNNNDFKKTLLTINK